MKADISDISFVIITLNEEFGVEKCLSSIYGFSLENCEVICIDSGSTDGTANIIKSYSQKFSEFSFFEIKGNANAAIGRNIGLKHAKKTFVFFIDGDIELEIKFIVSGLRLIRAGFCQAVTGNLVEYQYTKDYKKIVNTTVRKRTEKDRFIFFCGGVFLIERKSALATGSFNESFIINEDIDYMLRFTKDNKIYCLREQIGIHHTIPYNEWGRTWKRYSQGHPIFSGNILRSNLSNIEGLFVLLKSQAYYYLGIPSILLFVLGLLASKLFTWLFILVVLVDIICGLRKKQSLLYRMAIHYLYPLYVLVGLVYLPNKSPSYDYCKIL